MDNNRKVLKKHGGSINSKVQSYLFLRIGIATTLYHTFPFDLVRELPYVVYRPS